MKRTSCAVAATVLGLVPFAFGGSAWLPAKGRLVATPGYVYHEYDEFWVGDDKMDLPPELDEIKQHTFLLALEYGLFENVALDVTAGYTSVDSDLDDDEGMTDTHFGVRWRIVDEFRQHSPLVPTVTLRLGGIVQGTYDADYPYSAGDGASGVEGSVLLAKAFGDSGFGLNGELGYRYRAENVPEDVFGSVGAYQTLFDRLVLSVAYRFVFGQDGDDIGDPGFTFPEVKEEQQVIEGGIGYTDEEGRYAGVFVGQTVDGRNTGEKRIIGFQISWPF